MSICFACSGNRVFNPKDTTDAQSKILALLLHKSLAPFEKGGSIGETERIILNLLK